MQQWIQVGMSFVLGGVIGFLVSEKLSGDKLSGLVGRVASLEVSVESFKDNKPAYGLAERVSLLEKGAIAAAAPNRAPAVVAKPVFVAIEGAPIRGPVDAPVTIVEFSDFQCPFCSRVHPTLLRVLDEYPETVRLVFKHYPLAIHRNAPLAHRASMAADLQGRFWEMHDKIVANGRDLSRRMLVQHATDLDLDLAQFEHDLDSDELIKLLDRDIAEANRLGVTGTPTFYINGNVVSGAQPYENFKVLIDREMVRLGVSAL